MTSTRCGISALELEREPGVTYETAWRMAHLIQIKLMTQDSEPLDSGNPSKCASVVYWLLGLDLPT
jgi:hypothetical protein